MSGSSGSREMLMGTVIIILMAQWPSMFLSFSQATAVGHSLGLFIALAQPVGIASPHDLQVQNESRE